MYEEIYNLPPNQSWGRRKFKSVRSTRRLPNLPEKGFRCQHCGAYVHTLPMIAGVNNRNHCPYCLWSRHVDYLKPGDRMSACKAIMKPIGLTMKQGRDKYMANKTGELMLIHRCSDCSKLSINRIAADDQVEMVAGVYQSSLLLDEITLNHLELAKIYILQAKDEGDIFSQLYGQHSLE
jgi:hypothetical protein